MKNPVCCKNEMKFSVCDIIWGKEIKTFECVHCGKVKEQTQNKKVVKTCIKCEK